VRKDKWSVPIGHGTSFPVGSQGRKIRSGVTLRGEEIRSLLWMEIPLNPSRREKLRN